jgi:hypothetical protein
MCEGRICLKTFLKIGVGMPNIIYLKVMATFPPTDRMSQW